MFFISGNMAISTVQVTHHPYSQNRNLPISKELGSPKLEHCDYGNYQNTGNY